MVKRALVIAVVLGCAVALVAGCGDSGTGTDEPEPYNTIRLDLYTMGLLGDAMHYELWALPVAEELAAAQDDWVSLGRFGVILDGDTLRMVDLDGNLIPDNTLRNLPDIELSNFDSLFVTVEPSNDTDSLPSASTYLAGDIDFDETHFVSLEFPDAALGLLNDNAFFTYVTPTDNDTDSLNELSGIWFMLAGALQQGLFDMPPAPEGWLYQGWVQYRVDNQGQDELHILTTGRFADAGAEDMDAPYSASDNPPPGFPGEDFLANSPSVNLVFPPGPPENIWIAIEPSPDPDPATPFPYMVYEMRSGQTPGHQQNFRLDRKDKSTNDFPDASVYITRGTSD